MHQKSQKKSLEVDLLALHVLGGELPEEETDVNMNESDNLLSNIFGEDEDHIFPPLPLRPDDGCNEGRGVRLTRVKVEEGEGAAVVTPRDIPLSSVHTPPLPPHEQSRQPSDDPFSEAPSPSASSRARVSSESESSSSSSLVAPSGVPPSLRHRNKFALREQWMVRFRELLEYRQEHGHCNVPQRGRQLGCWVSTQRTQYKLMLEGRQTQMSQERVVSAPNAQPSPVRFPICSCFLLILHCSPLTDCLLPLLQSCAASLRTCSMMWALTGTPGGSFAVSSWKAMRPVQVSRQATRGQTETTASGSSGTPSWFASMNCTATAL